jgi:hypothetical protein
MKHYEVNFTDGSVETVSAGILPLDGSGWWAATLLTLDAETGSKLVPHGRIHINLDNVTFIKEA